MPLQLNGRKKNTRLDLLSIALSITLGLKNPSSKYSLTINWVSRCSKDEDVEDGMLELAVVTR